MGSGHAALGLEASLAFVLNQNGPFGVLASPVHSQGSDSPGQRACWLLLENGSPGTGMSTARVAQKLFCTQIIAHWDLFSLGVTLKRRVLCRHVLGCRFWQWLRECALWLMLLHTCAVLRERTSPSAQLPTPLHTCWGVLVYLLETCRGHSFLSTMEVFSGKA